MGKRGWEGRSLLLPEVFMSCGMGTGYSRDSLNI